METTMTLEKYKSMKKAKNIREEKNLNNIDKLKDFHPELCVECGLCSYICPSKLGLRDAVIMAKKKVK